MLANSENLSDSQPGTGYKEQEGTNISSGLELEREGKQGRKINFEFFIRNIYHVHYSKLPFFENFFFTNSKNNRNILFQNNGFGPKKGELH